MLCMEMLRTEQEPSRADVALKAEKSISRGSRGGPSCEPASTGSLCPWGEGVT